MFMKRSYDIYVQVAREIDRVREVVSRMTYHTDNPEIAVMIIGTISRCQRPFKKHSVIIGTSSVDTYLYDQTDCGEKVIVKLDVLNTID